MTTSEKVTLDDSWLLIDQGSRILVGKRVDSDDEASQIQLSPCYTTQTHFIPNERGMAKVVLFVKYDQFLEDVSVCVNRFRAFSIVHFKDVSEKDKKTYQSLIDGAEKMAMEERAKQSGLTLPGKRG